MDVAIINYGVSNLYSVQNACHKVGLTSVITEDYDVIMNSQIAILPGVGAYSEAMKSIKSKKLDKSIFDFIDSGKPFYGVCLGMQLLFEESEEFGVTKGLKLIKGKVKKFKETKNLKVPHIGWNNLTPRINNKNILKMINRNNKYYFVHSYYCVPKEDKIISSLTEYQNIKFCSSITQNNIVATQFHPEKSGEAGLKIIGGMYKYL